jgi:uncharacterized membrane protein (UPF0127 family)
MSMPAMTSRFPFRRLWCAVLLAGAAVTPLAVRAQPAQQPQQQQLKRFPVIPLTAGMFVIHAEVAAREAEREQGLMFREKMGPGEGMVFVFDAPAGVCMWMKNTLLPLSVAFIDETGKIINIEDMQPQTLDSHCAKGPTRYALEMNLGWFRQKGIKPGSVIGGLPGLPK